MKTSEFAKLCGVERRTLFYYDEIDLLKPSKVSENGYREYDAGQVSKLETIKLLQSTGLSLAEIKALLMNKEEGENVTIIEECAERAARQIKQLSDGRNYLLHRMDLRKCYYRHIGEEYFVEHMKSERLSVIRPDYRPRMSVNYHSFGYYLGIAEDVQTLKPRFFFKHALIDEPFEPFEEGDYICTFIEEKEGIYIPPFVKKFAEDVEKLGYKIEPTVYTEDLPSWMLDRPDAIIIRFSAKVI